MPAHAPATKGYVRRIYGYGFGVVVLVVLAIAFQGAIGQVDNLRAGCERGNTQRLALYRNTLRDARTRAAAAPQFPGVAGRRIDRYANQGFIDARALIDTYASVAIEPGSVEQDCSAAYPYPWPLG